MPDPKHRNRSIRNAISTSLVSKATSAVLQFGSMPLAARVLGREEFGIFATISMSLFAVNLLQLGVGPAAGKGISEAAASSDRLRESRIYLAGTVLVLVLGLLAVALIGLVLAVVPIPVLFGAGYASWSEMMLPALLLSSVLVAGEFLAGFQDRVREGYMEASVANAFAAGANLLCALSVMVGMAFKPTVLILLVSLFVPNILARLLSAVFLIRKRPYLLAWRGGPDRRLMEELIRDGLSFSATRTVVFLVEYNLCALLVGRLLGPGQVAIFHVLMSLNTAFAGLLIMIGTPMWAAMVDAKARGDLRWMAASTRNFYRFLVSCIVPATAGLIALGPWILVKWYGPEFATNRLLFAAFSLLLLARGWREVNHFLCVGLGKLQDTVGPVLAGLALGVALGLAGLHLMGLWALLAGLAGGALLIPGRKLPALVQSGIRDASLSCPSHATALPVPVPAP